LLYDYISHHVVAMAVLSRLVLFSPITVVSEGPL